MGTSQPGRKGSIWFSIQKSAKRFLTCHCRLFFPSCAVLTTFVFCTILHHRLQRKRPSFSHSKPLKKTLLLPSVMAHCFRLLDLPAELRYNIYHQALLPETLHVSLTGIKDIRYIERLDPTSEVMINSTLIGSSEIDPVALANASTIVRKVDSRKISFDHIFESRNKLVVESFSMSSFPISRQIYAELKHLFYTRCTWFFSNLDGLVSSLQFLPGHVRKKIRHLAFTLMSVELRSPLNTFPERRTRGGDQIWTLHSISALLQSQLQLHTLSIHYSKLDILFAGTLARALRQLSEGHKATCAVTQFIWPGLETRLLYGNAEMTADLVDSLGRIYGTKNVEWRSRGQDRYSTPLSELVIRQPRDSSDNSMRTRTGFSSSTA